MITITGKLDENDKNGKINSKFYRYGCLCPVNYFNSDYI